MAEVSRHTKTLDSGLDPAMREWVDRVIVPALMREWLEEEEKASFARPKIMRDSCESGECAAKVKS